MAIFKLPVYQQYSVPSGKVGIGVKAVCTWL